MSNLSPRLNTQHVPSYIRPFWSYHGSDRYRSIYSSIETPRHRASLGYENNNQIKIESQSKTLYPPIQYSSFNRIQPEYNKVDYSQMICQSHSYYVMTQKKILSFQYNWIIEKFCSFCQNYWILSEEFYPSGDPRYAFEICLRLNDDTQQDYLSLKLHVRSENIHEITVRYRVSILGAQRNSWSRCGEEIVNKGVFIIAISKFFPKILFQILDEYLPNDTLTLLCEIWIESDKAELKSETSLLCAAPTPWIQMSNVNLHASNFLMNSSSQIGGNQQLYNQ